ncbi:cell wall-binding repeat-containing protein [Clostridium sp. BJN0013]|uniref:cell wall-binding repeat-containing protein n=1 Tax=Clostridium sp. BJN0013 TaxID=3236840 RepID=UPI0034C5FE6C
MKKKGKKILSACSIASLLIASSTVSINVKAADPSSDGVDRLGGADRYETAAKVAQAGWQSSDYAILANGEGYADVLCAIPLAKAKDAPVLLTTGGSLNENALNELKSLDVKHVIVVGGTGVVSDNVINSIKSQGISDVERIGGQDRYETSVKIAGRLGVVTKATIANGEGYADALSAGPAAAIEGMPILLTRGTSLPDVTVNYIKSHSQITKTYVIGGTASVSNSIENSLPFPKRLEGSDRYETNVAVLTEFASDFSFKNVYMALGNGPTGNEFADALIGGVLAAKLKNPLIITGKTLSSSTLKFIESKGYKGCTLTVIGGTANIPNSLANYTNITSIVKANSSYEELVSSINGSQYFTIEDDDSSTINVQLKKDNVNSIEGIFEEAEDRYNSTGSVDEQQIRDDVDKVNDKLDILYNKNITVKVDGSTKSLAAFFGSLGSRYFDSEGKLDADAIVTQIEKKLGSTYDYNDFRTDLIEKIDYYFHNNSSSPESSLDLKVMGFEVNSIKKGNSVLYKSNYIAKVAAKKLVHLLMPAKGTDITGTYTIYVDGSSYVRVKVIPKSN